MTEQLVREWLSDYSSLSPVELHSFVASLEHNQELVSAVYAVLENREHFQKLFDPVCNQLFAFFRSRETALKEFSLQFIPTFVYVYLNSVACGKKESCWSLETVLIGMYNLEVVDESGQPKVISFRLPSLAQPSIYHEPMHLDPASLTQKELRRLEECNTKLISWGPLPQVESINAQNRLKVMTALLFIFNRHLSRFNKSALEKLCRVGSKLAVQGFSRSNSYHHQFTSSNSTTSMSPQRPLSRIPVSIQFLLELLHAIYFAMFNEFSSMAVQALEDIHFRGCYECLPEVILVAGAIRNSIKDTTSGQALDGPMGISLAVSSSTNTVTVSKSMITNASFRTKKLPDDLEEELVVNLSASQQELLVWQQHKGSTEASPDAPVRPARHRKGRSWKHYHKGSLEEDLNEGKLLEDKERKASPKKCSSRRGSGNRSSTNSPSSRKSSVDVSSPSKIVLMENGRVERTSSQSPKHSDVILRDRPDSRSPSNRMSAGARLFRVSEEESMMPGPGEKERDLCSGVRPASISISPSRGNNFV